MVDPSSAGADSVRRRPWLEFLVVFSSLTIAIVIFLWRPLTTNGWYAAGDVSGVAGILRTPGESAGEIRQIDVTVDFLPWMKFQREELSAGRLPEWNPYNGSGVPHIANLQSAVFSPFTVPFYLLSMRWALLLSAYLILVTAGSLTYLLCRRLRLSLLGSFASALIYMFSSTMVIWLRWPVAGTSAFIPGLLWAGVSLVDGRRRAAIWSWTVAFAAFVALTIMAGHPEAALFGMLFSALLLATLIVVVTPTARDRARALLRLGVGGALGVALSAVQLLPFLEYLSRGAASQGRAIQVFQPAKAEVAQVTPLVFGSPGGKYRGLYSLAIPFHEFAAFYVGSVAVVLACLGVVASRWTGRRLPWFLAAVVVLGQVFIFNIAGLGRAVTGMPGFSLIMPSRIAPVMALATALLAGFGIDGISHAHEQDRQRRSVSVLLVVGMIFVVGSMYASWTVYHHAFLPSIVSRTLARNTARQHLLFVGVTFAAAVVFILFVSHARRLEMRRVASVGIVAVLFAQGGFMWRSLNTSVPESRFMQFSKVSQRVAEELGDSQSLWTGSAYLMPDLNMWLRTRIPYNYDVIGLATNEKAFRTLLRPPKKLIVGGAQLGMLGGQVSPRNTAALESMGIRRIVSDRSYPFVKGQWLGRILADKNGTFDGRIAWRGPAPNELVVYGDTSPQGRLLSVTFHGAGVSNEQRVRMHGGIAAVAVPRAVTRGGKFDVTVRNVEKSRARGAKIIGVLGVISQAPGLVITDSIGGYQIYRVPGPDAVAFSPATISWASSSGEALKQMTNPDFSAAREVIVTDKRAAASGAKSNVGPGRVSVDHFGTDHVVLSVDRATPGMVVLDQNDYPGWKATVNGRAVRVRQANSTFMAVEVPAGRSTVEFRFRSDSIVYGGSITLLSLVVSLIIVILAMYRELVDRYRNKRAGVNGIPT